MSCGHVDIFLLLAPAFPSTPNHIFGTTQDSLMNLRTANLRFKREKGVQSPSWCAVSISSYTQVTQGTIY